MRPDASEKLAAVAPKKGPNKALIALAAVLVIALIFAGFWYKTASDQKNNNDKLASTTKTSDKLPAGGLEGGKGLQVYANQAKADAKKVDVYVDMQCPYCGKLEQNQGKAIVNEAKSGNIKLTYHMKSFLDENIPGENSARAANAAFAAADAGKFPEFLNYTFEHQPKEGDGYSVEKLLENGKAVGISGDAYTTFEKAVKTNKYADYVKATEQATNADGVNSTPSLRVNGKDLDNSVFNGLVEGMSKFADVIKSA